MAEIDITLVSHRSQIDPLIENGVKKALSLMGEVVEGYAKENCPVDTGNLRNSITHQGGEGCEYVGTNVEYAPYVEFMDMSHKVGQAHYLRDGAQNHIKEIQEVGQAALNSV